MPTYFKCSECGQLYYTSASKNVVSNKEDCCEKCGSVLEVVDSGSHGNK